MKINTTNAAGGEKKGLPRSWQFFRSITKSDVAFVTIIISAIPASRHCCKIDIKNKIHEEITSFKKIWLSLSKGRRLPKLRFRGSFEFDLSRAQDIQGHRQSLYDDLSVPQISTDDRIINLHIHLLIACNSHELNKLSNVLQRTWRGRWRVLVKSLYENQSTDDAILYIYRYITKKIYRYSIGGIGDEPVQFNLEWEDFWAEVSKYIYDSMDFDFRSSDRWIH